MDRAQDRPVRGRLILVTGGARSGKSTYAERLAAQLAEPHGGRVTYIATSQTYDEEMEQRVTAHQASRPETWTTVECPVEVPAAVRAAAAGVGEGGAGAAGPTGSPPVILLDCVTLWVTNLLFSGGAFGGSEPPEGGYNYDKDLLPPAEERAAAARVTAAVTGLIAAVAETGVTLVAVTNEVGLGVVPEYPLARLYRDQLGWANQRLARDADGLYLLVSGHPLDVKALAAGAPAAAGPSSTPSPDDLSSPPKESQ
ncbi:MAG TPA: bifunctional adenosylcobinamide kinase/adenosylcobinamide-phosphate guanylyltransferase [Thermoleophilia bacterium]|nr:bifunctional adenosylcobinamide kinase/adenosylcobinamide-phosphate guanylyltransferase [Thermoleophilia bacterium]